jgi:hypothetical protein
VIAVVVNEREKRSALPVPAATSGLFVKSLPAKASLMSTTGA